MAGNFLREEGTENCREQTLYPVIWPAAKFPKLSCADRSPLPTIVLASEIG